VTSSSTAKILLGLALTVLVGASIGAIAAAKMRSERIEPNLCETTGGGRFVTIPGFPGEKIDRRLKRDVKMLVRKYKLQITDGYSLDPVHSRKGEHPIGLALDIVPDTSHGGRWRDVGRLARWAEPKRDRPRAPFRWVGYNGDAGHGRGHHLHLSWGHSETRYNRPARTVYTLRCPRSGSGGDDKAPTEPENPSGGGVDGGGKVEEPAKEQPKNETGSGGISPTRSFTKTTGGVTARAIKRKIRRQQRDRSSRELGGISLR
jgi:hypothetical protein